MTKKKERNKKGREVRDTLKIPFTDAMKIGRILVKYDKLDDIVYEFEQLELVGSISIDSDIVSYPCGEGCCSGERQYFLNNRDRRGYKQMYIGREWF